MQFPRLAVFGIIRGMTSLCFLPLLAAMLTVGPVGEGRASGQKDGDWPLITVRHDGGVNANPDLLRGEMEINRRYPGACDEVWFCGGGLEPTGKVAEIARSFARYRELCERSGVRLSYQQGRTLGHGARHDGVTKSAFPEDAWQVDCTGKRCVGIFCPRSPDALAHERAFVKTVVSVAHPWSYWLDDDLRMGVSKPKGCFCDRCLAAFNAKTGDAWTRETLVAKIFGKDPRVALRAAWLEFNQESLAMFATVAREAAAEADPDCRLGYQAVWSDTIYTGRDNRRLLEALSGPTGRTVGIRPGAGVYTEATPRDFVRKSLSVAREAERCRDYGFVGSVCYEQETYPRRVLQKSPGAVITECSLALASGCTALSLYWYIGEAPEPLDEYERAAKAVSEARPYFERLVKSVRRTRLTGVSRFVGSAADETADFNLRDETDFVLSLAGVPVSVAEAGYPLWYLTEKSRAEMTASDEEKVRGRTVNVPEGLFRSPVPGYLTVREREKLLDEIDRVSGGRFPVRLEECRAVRILPRTDAEGRLDSVTLLNCSIGETDGLTLRVRHPVQAVAEFWTPRVDRERGKTLDCVPSGREGEWIVRIPSLQGWQIGTVFFR